jgi:hypothetical protein
MVRAARIRHTRRRTARLRKELAVALAPVSREHEPGPKQHAPQLAGGCRSNSQVALGRCGHGRLKMVLCPGGAIFILPTFRGAHEALIRAP